jgi:hypothetical protein
MASLNVEEDARPVAGSLSQGRASASSVRRGIYLRVRKSPPAVKPVAAIAIGAIERAANYKSHGLRDELPTL